MIRTERKLIKLLGLIFIIVLLLFVFTTKSRAADYNITVTWEDFNDFTMVDYWDFYYSFDQVTWIKFITTQKPDAQASEYSDNGVVNTIEGYNYIYVKGRTIDINGLSSDDSEVAKSAFRAGFPFPVKIKAITKKHDSED